MFVNFLLLFLSLIHRLLRYFHVKIKIHQKQLSRLRFHGQRLWEKKCLICNPKVKDEGRTIFNVQPPKKASFHNRHSTSGLFRFYFKYISILPCKNQNKTETEDTQILCFLKLHLQYTHFCYCYNCNLTQSKIWFCNPKRKQQIFRSSSLCVAGSGLFALALLQSCDF